MYLWTEPDSVPVLEYRKGDFPRSFIEGTNLLPLSWCSDLSRSKWDCYRCVHGAELRELFPELLLS